LLLKGEDVLLVDKVYESEMFVEDVTVVLDALLEVGDAHILVAITLQGAQEGLFGEAGDLLRYAAESLGTLWGGRLLEFYIFLFPNYTLRTATTNENENKGTIIDIDVWERRRCNSWVPLLRCARCSSS